MNIGYTIFIILMIIIIVTLAGLDFFILWMCKDAIVDFIQEKRTSKKRNK